jgi:hypothetical protein
MPTTGWKTALPEEEGDCRHQFDGGLVREKTDVVTGSGRRVMKKKLQDEEAMGSAADRLGGEKQNLTLKIGSVYHVRNSTCIHLREPNV